MKKDNKKIISYRNSIFVKKTSISSETTEEIQELPILAKSKTKEESEG